MDIKLELFKRRIWDMINNSLSMFEIDADEIADTTAIQVLYEIKKVIENEELDDFYVVEEIVCIFEKYGISAGVRHDFQKPLRLFFLLQK